MHKEMDLRFLAVVFIVMAIFWLLFLPKIYIQNSVYYKSREIATLQREYDTLMEENRLLHRKVEQIYFKHTVLDTIFEIEE